MINHLQLYTDDKRSKSPRLSEHKEKEPEATFGNNIDNNKDGEKTPTDDLPQVDSALEDVSPVKSRVLSTSEENPKDPIPEREEGQCSQATSASMSP